MAFVLRNIKKNEHLCRYYLYKSSINNTNVYICDKEIKKEKLKDIFGENVEYLHSIELNNKRFDKNFRYFLENKLNNQNPFII